MSVTIEDVIEVFSTDEIPNVKPEVLLNRGEAFVETMLNEAAYLEGGSLEIEAEMLTWV